MIKAVLFDLDGTLANTLNDLGNAVNYVLEKNNYPTHLLESYKLKVGGGMANLIHKSLPESERNEETEKKVLTEFLDYYSKHFADETCTYSGIDELLHTLKSMGMSLAVVTNKAQDMTDLVMKKLFSSDTFDYVIGKRDGIPTKPDPKPAFIAIDKLGVNSDECIFVGDSGVDMLTALNCGALPVGVLWGFRSADELKKSGSRFLLREPYELVKLIEAING